jgi:predicted RNA-binding Zn-ribbon protein involved in translation (DUF1610 family)
MFETAQIDIPCPNCGAKTKKTVGWLKAYDDVVCSGCGANIKIDKSKFTAPLRDLDKGIENIKRAFKRLGR